MPGVAQRIGAGVRNGSGLLWLAVIVLAVCAVLSIDPVNDLATGGLGGLQSNRMAAGVLVAAVLALLTWLTWRSRGNAAVVAAVLVAVGATWLFYAKQSNGTVSGTVDAVQWGAGKLREFVATLKPWDWQR